MILDRTIIDSDKSSFVIRLCQTEKGQEYVEIEQKIKESDDGKTIKLQINPVLLPKILDALEEYFFRTKNVNSRQNNVSISERDKKIAKYYLKGVSIEDLSLQTGKSKKSIIEILRKQNMEIVSNKAHSRLKNLYKKRFRKRRR